jgi:hypothetical protein
MRRVSIAIVAAVMLLAACGGDSEPEPAAEDTGTAQPTEATGSPATESPSGECTDLSAGEDFEVELEDFSFRPVCVIASRSQPLIVKNRDGVLHNFSLAGTPVDVDVPPDSEVNLEPIEDAIEAGTYVMFCKYHGSPDGNGMAGELRAT